ncbi:MAG TPA: PAS domain S-box protein [Acidimicrobiales bacterium]|nr:PAS domain S-box protein [Acidimicrobiales bacterium]
MPDWVVLLEATADVTEPLSAGEVRRLQEALDVERSGGAIRSGERYALQVTAAGNGPVEALLDVVARWSAAARGLGLPPSRLIRTEVCTPDELDREFEESDRGWFPHQPPPAPSGVRDDGDELLRRAFSDPLTGLLGRAALVRQVEVTLTRTDTVAMVCLDLDGFRGPNSVLCGATRDHVMLTLARRLAPMLRPRDVLGRLGPDEFGVLLYGGEEAGLAVARRLLAAARAPVPVPGREVVVSANAGVAVGRPADAAQVVIQNAEWALSMARAAGGEPVLHGCDLATDDEPAEAVATPTLQDPLANVYLLRQAAVAANEADTFEQAAEVVAREISNYVDCDVSQVWVAPAASSQEPPSPEWRLVSSCRRAAQTVTDGFLAGPLVGLTGRLLATGRPAWIPHLAADDVRSAFAFPVTLENEVVAVLAFFSRDHMEPSSSFDDVVAGIAGQLGRLVERQRAATALRRSAEELRASEALLSEAHLAGRLGSWHFDLRRAENNRMAGMQRLYGMPSGERLDMATMLATVDTRDRGRAEAALLRLVQTGEPTTEEIRIRGSDGRLRWVRAQGSAVRDDAGDVVAIHGTVQDITEAKAAQEALVERERQYAEAERSAGLGWWERDLVSGRLTWSGEMYRLWHWPGDMPVTAEATIAKVHVDDRQKVLEAAAQLRMTGRPFCVDFRVVLPDGRLRWLRSGGHVVRNHVGTPLKLFGTVQDISQQRQTEEELRSSKLLYQRIVETTREGIVTVDAGNRITFVNTQLGQLLGYRVDEMTGMAASSLLGADSVTLLSGHPERRRGRLSEHYEAQLRSKDGHTVRALLSVSPFVDGDGEYVGALAMVSDITAVREAEEILRLQSAQILAEEDDR